MEKLKLLRYEHSADHAEFFTPVIFIPINMCQWNELVPSGSLNALLVATTAQAELFKMMAESLYGKG